MRSSRGRHGIINVSTTELNEQLRSNVFVCIFHNRWISNLNFFASTVHFNDVLVGSR
ncbi:MAG: hypothetical protein ACI90S_000258 [Marinobacter psychrophilus]|jgi:hypothetical protein